jgi:hypothetical protein
MPMRVLVKSEFAADSLAEGLRSCGNSSRVCRRRPVGSLVTAATVEIGSSVVPATGCCASSGTGAHENKRSGPAEERLERKRSMKIGYVGVGNMGGS